MYMRNLTKVIIFYCLSIYCSLTFAITNLQVFSYAEANYPNFFSGTPTDGQYQQYTYRYYSGTGNYIGIDDKNEIYILGPDTGNALTSVGSVSSYADLIAAWENNIAIIKFEYEVPVIGKLPEKTSINVPEIRSDGSVIGVTKQPLVGLPDKMWTAGQTLTVSMTGGSAIVRSKVRLFAEEWTNYANIKFNFVDDAAIADIKIHFSKGGSWSTIGRDALLVPFDFPTMNFGWLNDDTPDDEVRRVVLHEFGHALGLTHEHQSPTAGIPWNKEKVYSYYRITQNPPWSKEDVDSNVFMKYEVSSTNYSQYDPTSIMHYSIPPELTLDGSSVPENTTLSNTDIEYIRLWYPQPTDALGQLRTGDDCDIIEFKVEYGVEDPEFVHFTLNPGSIVTWWKMIEIPIEGSEYIKLRINRGAFDPPTPPDENPDRFIHKVSLDSSRPIRFNKAKFLGVHTLLDYRWDVISALPGGSRVTLDWVKDTCG
jgi:serralysin